jgi:hypothetical protein
MQSWYEEGKIHQSLASVMVRSKSEVIIANMLAERNIPFRYEIPLQAPDGTFYLPDFTITWNGERWYWEQLGIARRREVSQSRRDEEEMVRKAFFGTPCRYI